MQLESAGLKELFDNGRQKMRTSILQRLIEPKQMLTQERRRFSDKDLIRLVMPIVAEQFLELLVGIADTLMVSY